MTAIQTDKWELVHETTYAPAKVGQVEKDFRGDVHTIMGGTPPHTPSSSGHVETDRGRFYASVCSLKWISK